MSILLPPSVAADLERDRWTEEQYAYAKRFEREVLKPLDPKLELRFVHPEAPEEYDVKPGRWHVIVRNDRGPDKYMPITGPLGEYMEPHHGIVDQLRQMDLQGKDIPALLNERRYKQAQRKAKAQEEEKAERLDELQGRLKAYDNPGISFSRSGPWRYRASARRG